MDRCASHAYCSDFILALTLVLCNDDRMVWDALVTVLVALVLASCVACVARLVNFDNAASAAVGEDDDSDNEDDLFAASTCSIADEECDDEEGVDLLEQFRRGINNNRL